MSSLEEELKIVQEIYNSTLDRNWGFIPITMDELLASAEDMKAFADPKMIADRGDQWRECGRGFVAA